jgi:hypothetical protein|tara:strand:- start:522 stop:1073 length:552 start_codon:yes stop_codon:yes gene_type:complete
MNDKDSSYLFESYQNHLLEGRKKQFTDRVRKTLVDPDTGEERKESYYEMMMRVKGIRGGGGARSRTTRFQKPLPNTKVSLKNRRFNVADQAYQVPLKGLQKDIVSFVEIRTSSAKEILDFASKIEDQKEAERVLKDMILLGLLDEVFKNEEAPEPEVDPDKLGEIEAFHDPAGPEAVDDLEDY